MRLARGVAPSGNCFLRVVRAKKIFSPNRRRSTPLLARASPRVEVPGRATFDSRSVARTRRAARSAPLASRGSRHPVPGFRTFREMRFFDFRVADADESNPSSLAPLLPYAPSVKYNTDHNIHVRSPDDLMNHGEARSPRSSVDIERRRASIDESRARRSIDLSNQRTNLGKLYAVDNNVAHDIEDRGMSALI